MSALARLLHRIRRARLVRLARERRIERLRSDLDYFEKLIDSCAPISAALVAKRQQLVRRLDAYEGEATRFGEPA